MYVITGYTIAPASGNITVALAYPVTDPLRGPVTVTGGVVLQDGVGALESPHWGDAELLAAVAAAVLCDPSLVTLSSLDPD